MKATETTTITHEFRGPRCLHCGVAYLLRDSRGCGTPTNAQVADLLDQVAEARDLAGQEGAAIAYRKAADQVRALKVFSVADLSAEQLCLIPGIKGRISNTICSLVLGWTAANRVA